MVSKTLQNTYKRNGNFYLQFRLKDGRTYKRSLRTDSYREASTVLISITPYIPFVKSLDISVDRFNDYLNTVITKKSNSVQVSMVHCHTMTSGDVMPVEIPTPVTTPASEPAPSKDVLTLSKAWKMYKEEKGSKWTLPIAQANERYMGVLLAALGEDTDVSTVTKKDIRQVMEIVENLPKRVIQPYRSMTVEQLINCDDVPEEDLIGDESIFKHLKIYKSVFKTYLTDKKDILSKSPTDGITASPSKARYGAYTNSEMCKLVEWALKQPEGWQKWVILLLAYTGARRGEIAKLEKSQIKYDDDSKRHYILIAEGGQGKTENATRQVVIHENLIEWGFLDFVKKQTREKIFYEVSSTNMAKIGKIFADVRESLGIPYLDDYGQRRILHSIRHSVCTTALAGWVSNLAHLQQTVGHEKSAGITKRYLHTFPLQTICYVIDGIEWR